jgi:hypothetical protein
MFTVTKAKTAKTAKKGKRGRPEKRLVITEDPQAALLRLLKPVKK